MKAFYSLLKTDATLSTLLLRLTLGLAFFPHGMQKTLGWFGGSGFKATLAGMHNGMGIPTFFVLLAILAESAGALGLIVGLFTRVAAFGIGVTMVVAVAMVHGKYGFFMNWHGSQAGEGWEYHFLVIGIAVVLMLKGGGLFSADAELAKRIADPSLARE